MDKIDQKLIALLQKNARYTIKQIAQEVFLSSPAVSARIERLEEQGIIKGYRAIIDARKLGYPLTAFINVVMPPERKPAFISFIRSCPNVVECSAVTGNYTMLVKVLFPDPQGLDEFVAKLQKFGKTQTQVVFSTPVESREIDLSDFLKEEK